MKTAFCALICFLSASILLDKELIAQERITVCFTQAPPEAG